MHMFKCTVSGMYTCEMVCQLLIYWKIVQCPVSNPDNSTLYTEILLTPILFLHPSSQQAVPISTGYMDNLDTFILFSCLECSNKGSLLPR